MTAEIGMVVIGLLSVIVDYVPLFMIFPCRFSRRMSITATILFVATFYSVLIITGTSTSTFNGLRGFVHIPFIIFLFRGQFFQKTFAVFLVMLLAGMQIFPSKMIAGILAPSGSPNFYWYYIAVLSVMYIIFVLLMFRFGRHIFKKLFITGKRIEWAIYSLCALISLFVMALFQYVPVPIWVNISMLIFILWSLCVLCFAIINTHEKTKQRDEADFARSIISSGQGHSQTLNEMYDTLGILRHDYKYHMNTISELAQSGDIEAIKEYLTDIEAQIPENEFRVYCSNSVINALIGSYAERCIKLNIKYRVNISMPDALVTPNYEMCIVLGNLLENAVEACAKKECGGKIELTIKNQGAQLAVLVKNSFNGYVIEANGQLVSEKKDGGFGLRSVKAVAERYGGHTLTKWDDDTFSVYVMLKM